MIRVGGHGVQDLKEVWFPSGSVVGAASVVMKPIYEKNVIAAGMPAGVVRRVIHRMRFRLPDFHAGVLPMGHVR